MPIAACRGVGHDGSMDDAVPHAAPRARTWLRRGAIALAALLAFWALAWIAVPPLAKWQGEQRLSALLGREVRIGRVAFAPWSLALTVEDLDVGPEGGKGPPQLQVGRIHVDAELRSLLRLAPVVQALEVDAPRLRLAHIGDGRYDIDDILARLKPKDDAAATGEPARFALYNLRLTGGRLFFDDQPVQRQHMVDALQLTLPFLSNLPADIEVNVEPRLAFKLNGAAFDSGAQAQPFTKDRHAALKLAIANLDLAPWLAYLPANLPFRPLRGTLAGDLAIQFSLASDGAPKVAVAGQASLANAAFVAGGSREPAIAWKGLAVGLKDVQPLAQRVALGTVRLEGATIDARRAEDGAINLVARASGAAAPAPAASAAASAAAPGNPWRLTIDKFELAGARIDWRDATTRPAAALRVDALDVAVGPLQWPFDATTAPLQVQGRIAPPDAAASAASFSVQGNASDRAAQVALALDGLDLRWLAPYVAEALQPSVEGRVRAQTNLEWASGDTPKLALSGLAAQLDNLRIVERASPKTPAVALAVASLADTRIDLMARRIALGSVKLDRPALRLSRDKDGRLNALAWTKGGGASVGATPSAAPAPPPWQLLVDEAQVSAGDVLWIDESPAPGTASTARVRATAIVATVRGLAWPGGAGSAPARTQLTMRVTDQEGAPAKGTLAASIGRVEWTGQVAAAPLSARGRLKLNRVPLHAVAPYVDSGLPVEILRAEATWQGDIAFAQRGDAIEATAKGDALIGDLRVHERSAAGSAAAVRGGDELLTWQSFALTGVQFAMAPGSKPSLAIGEAALSDFYSRLVITEDGRFNLRDVAAAPKAADAGAAAASAPASAATSAPAAAAAPQGLPIDLRIGGVRLASGKVDFTDRFIKPNYSAALTELNGTLGAFDSTRPRELATLSLKGRAAGTALLEISGSLNPTAQPLALDIQARATDLELAPLSPYAGRYAGYAIERGKLSMDVAYKIDPDGKLDAKNQIILNQLTFGDKVESPDATKLPVLLAVALLKDRNGVIDINLPISGSINDPQFSVFGLVLKVIGNLLIKALTAPFALLAGGGGEDLSFVGFVPGTNTFNDSGKATLDKVAKALADRPALKMTVTGAADPASEREAIQRAALDARIAAEQRKEMLRAGAATDAPLPPLTPPQREVLLKRIYDDTKLPDKPRNVIGLAKTIPAAEMEALLTKATVVSTDSARELALQRGLAVRDALIAKGLPSERLFIAAPKLRASGEEDAAWSPRVQLALGTN